MKEALSLADAAALRDEVPVGAVLVHEGTIVGRGSNAREQTARVVSHAEINALEDYSRRTGQWRVPQGSSLYVTVEPCLMCVGALLWARVDSIHFGCCDPKNAGLLAWLPQIENGVFDHRFKTVETGCEQVACSQLMKDFFRRKRAEKSTTKGAFAINP